MFNVNLNRIILILKNSTSLSISILINSKEYTSYDFDNNNANHVNIGEIIKHLRRFRFNINNCQNVDEIPIEMDFSGSGDGGIDTLSEASTSSPDYTPVLEEVESKSALAAMDSAKACDICTCSEEGHGDTYTKTVDCSNKGLHEVPVGIDEDVTKLNLQHNHLEAIPKSIAVLKKLKILNANDNSIKQLEFGVSI